MSSLFTASEIALAQLGLAALPGTSFDVVVGDLASGTPRGPCWSMRRWARSWWSTPLRK